MRNSLIKEVLGFLLVTGVLFSPAVAMVAEERQGATDPLAGLTAALKATPGCLGIGTAMTESGKQVIFAWFENKQAALAPGSLKSQVLSKFRNHRH